MIRHVVRASRVPMRASSAASSALMSDLKASRSVLVMGSPMALLNTPTDASACRSLKSASYSFRMAAWVSKLTAFMGGSTLVRVDSRLSIGRPAVGACGRVALAGATCNALRHNTTVAWSRQRRRVLRSWFRPVLAFLPRKNWRGATRRGRCDGGTPAGPKTDRLSFPPGRAGPAHG